jgi:Ca2+:H+ antiporter
MPQSIVALQREWPLAVSLATVAVFLVWGERWLADLSNVAWFTVVLGCLFGAILVSAFAVVRHAEGLAELLGEPIGTLVLTLSMSGMEMMTVHLLLFLAYLMLILAN